MFFSVEKKNEDFKDLDEVCSVVWYEDIATATCASDELPGLLVRNVKTQESTLGEGHAKIQIEWNNEKQVEAATS